MVNSPLIRPAISWERWHWVGSPLGSHDIFFPWGRYFFPPIIMEVEPLGVLESDVWCLVSKPGLFSTSISSMINGGKGIFLQKSFGKKPRGNFI